MAVACRTSPIFMTNKAASAAAAGSAAAVVVLTVMHAVVVVVAPIVAVVVAPVVAVVVAPMVAVVVAPMVAEVIAHMVAVVVAPVVAVVVALSTSARHRAVLIAVIGVYIVAQPKRQRRIARLVEKLLAREAAVRTSALALPELEHKQVLPSLWQSAERQR
eukprot:6154284-Pleurochrysis_carterae.AAC.4